MISYRSSVTNRIQLIFLALVLVQAVHSIEEYLGRLYEQFPPARFISGLLSRDLERGFVIGNVALVGFGLWCYAWPVRKRWPSALPLIWLWIGIELVNGIGHPVWSVMRGGYTPGVATAPLLFALALYLAIQLAALRRPAAVAPVQAEGATNGSVIARLPRSSE